MIDINEKFRKLVKTIKNDAPFVPEIAIILGSGLGELAEKLDVVKSIATSSLPGYPVSTIEGHKGFIHFAEYKGKKVLLFQGRIHFYEGYPISDCIVTVHIAYKLGCKNILLTNAAGGVNPNFKAGNLMMLTSVNSLNLKKEMADLFGIISIDQKNAFQNFPSKELNSKIIKAALEEKVCVKEGVYWINKGPMYETPAEIQMASKFGADAVGMSTAHEAIYGASVGMKVAGISCITNMAAGISPNKLSHNEVMETADLVKNDFERLVKKFIELV